MLVLVHALPRKARFVTFHWDEIITRCQNTGITRDALRYSRSNRNFALLEIIPEIHSENVITAPQGREIEI